MKTPRFAFTLLTTAAATALLLASAHADERTVVKVKAKESSSWNFDAFSSWVEEVAGDISDSVSGPKRTGTPFRWTGKIAAGKNLEVRGVNGTIRAVPSNGSEVEVVAIRTGRKSDPDSVRIEVVPHSGGVTVCAVYPSRDDSRPNECKQGGGRMNVRGNDVSVEFEVRVPRDVAFEGRTVNGSIHAEVEGRASVATVNGSIEVEAGALTDATTVNGSIRATVRTEVNSPEDIKLTTVNGSVRLRLPEGVNADVSAKTVNGGITSEFDGITVHKKWGPRSAEGRLGNGGRELEVTTVNGGITISKGSDR
ncbi:MAG: DUF4097 family beta strand repeat-containing protein [Vicinamibacteria bacterium]